MSAKIFLVMLFLWCSTQAGAFIPPATYVLEQIAKKNPLKNIHPAEFNAMLAAGTKRDFLKLKLNSQGLHDGERFLELFSLSALLNTSNARALKAYLSERGVDLNIISLGFFANEPVYIIGAAPGDHKSSQIWVLKSHWLIVKEIHKNREIVFDKWQALNNQIGAKFPRLFNIKDNDDIKKYSIAEVPDL